MALHATPREGAMSKNKCGLSSKFVRVGDARRGHCRACQRQLCQLRHLMTVGCVLNHTSV
ncbi:hypothetical protein QR685DRAFT_90568 [Neurospora intermedia]|uniref:Nuclear receptor domain-containing protein n=1 Tax=Neurospora intermedia TaxID=5142 RepID=A0ABR3D2C6_NEUIN